MIRRTLAVAAVFGGALAATACSSESTGVEPAGAAFLSAPTSPTPPPPPPPGPTTPEDSVQSGYGSGSTGGIEYQNFEYEPETGTEYVATPDTTPSKQELEPTGP
ncbi:MAG TPA: hypothetical protein VFQ45_13155 [Longimicrobium sp.]|nr:hypothetical protein [Longimicrobium sp.]